MDEVKILQTGAPSLSRVNSPASLSKQHLEELEAQLPGQATWKTIERSELQRAVRDFIEFFDDCDTDGSNTISEIELTAGLHKLLPKLRADEPDTAMRIAFKLLRDWADVQKNSEMVQSRQLDGNDDFVLLHELERQDLLEVLLVALRHPVHCHLADWGYVVGGYTRDSSATKSTGTSPGFEFPVVWKLLYNQIGFFFMPLYAFVVDFSRPGRMAGIQLALRERIILSLICLPVYGMMAYCLYLWIANVDGVRDRSKDSAGGHIEFLEMAQPFLWMAIFCLEWNVASFLEGLGLFKRHRIRNPGRHVRFRRLHRLPLEHTHVYVSDGVDPRWVEGAEVGLSFSNAYELYRNIFNVVGFTKGLDQPLNFIKSHELYRTNEDTPDAQIVRELNPRRSVFFFMFHKASRIHMVASVALVIALIFPLHREWKRGPARFWAGEDSASFTIITCSIVFTWLWCMLVLMQLDHSRRSVRTYKRLFHLLSSVISRRRSRLVQLFDLPPRTKELSKEVYFHLTFPWLPLLFPRNLYAWNEIRSALTDEWTERFHGARSVMAIISFFTHVTAGATSLIIVIVSQTEVDDAVQWWAFVLSVVLYFPMQSFLSQAVSINAYKRLHLRMLNRARMRLQMDEALARSEDVPAKKPEDEESKAVDHDTKHDDSDDKESVDTTLDSSPNMLGTFSPWQSMQDVRRVDTLRHRKSAGGMDEALKQRAPELQTLLDDSAAKLGVDSMDDLGSSQLVRSNSPPPLPVSPRALEPHRLPSMRRRVSGRPSVSAIPEETRSQARASADFSDEEEDLVEDSGVRQHRLSDEFSAPNGPPQFSTSTSLPMQPSVPVASTSAPGPRTRAASVYSAQHRMLENAVASAALETRVERLQTLAKQGDSRALFKLKGDLIASFIQQIEGDKGYFHLMGFDLDSSFMYNWRSAWLTWFVFVSVNFFLTDVNL